MAYEDDKRIRDLTTGSSMPLNWRFPLDFTGLTAAEYRTLQQLIDTVNDNLELPNITSGSTNPDNAFGNDGDTYYKYVTGSVFGVWFKSIGVWNQLFEIDLGSVPYPVTLDANGEYDFTGIITKAFPCVTIYDSSGNTAPYFYNNTTKKITGGVPSEAITVTFI